MKPIGCDRPGRPRRSCPPLHAKQGKLPAAQEFKLAGKDSFMSEQKLSYMEQLDAWTSATVINPLHQAIVEGDSHDCDVACDRIKAAIRAKVWESYKNGQAAGPKAIRPARKEPRYAQAKTR